MIVLFLVVGAMRERWMLVVFGIAMIAVVGFVPSVTQRFSDLIHVASRSSDRDVVWRGALMLADQHPVFGFGPRTFNEIFPLRAELSDKGVSSWHNDFIQIYMESGIIGLLSVVGVFGSAFYFGLRSLKNVALPNNLREVLIALLVSLAVIVVVGGILDVLVSLLVRVVLAPIALIATEYSVKATRNVSLHAVPMS
jgi:O-antigen ligase